MSGLSYALSSLAWTILGVVASSIYWRIFYRRILVRHTKAQREPGMAVFVAVLAGLAVAASVLLQQAQRITFEHYVVCQANKEQEFRSAISQYAKESRADRHNLRRTVLALLAGRSGAQPNPLLVELQHGASVRKVLEQAFQANDSNKALEQLVKRSEKIDATPLPPLTADRCPPPGTGSAG